MHREITLVAHNLRSCHNVGSLLRTAEGLDVSQVILSGYTPYPVAPGDNRMPHEAQKLARMIHKTALGAEESVSWSYISDIQEVISQLRSDGWYLAAIEQASGSQKLPEYHPPRKIAIFVGREVEGIEPEVLSQMDTILEIPMLGSKESFNVVQAAAMALYHCRFSSV